MQRDCDLTGKIALVTGAAGGLGAQIAAKLERAGARVFATDLNEETLGQARTAFDADWDMRVLDVANLSRIHHQVASIAADAGRIDILVNCAGIYRMQYLADITEAEFDALISVNLKSVLFMTREVARHMIANGTGGAIVNVASAAGRRATVGSMGYSASKAGVISLTQGAASELAASGIRVNAIAPGAVETRMWEQVQQDYQDKLPPDGPTIVEAQLAMTPLGRICTAEDCARAVLFFASEQSAFITGQTLNVDGGMWMN